MRVKKIDWKKVWRSVAKRHARFWLTPRGEKKVIRMLVEEQLK